MMAYRCHLQKKKAVSATAGINSKTGSSLEFNTPFEDPTPLKVVPASIPMPPKEKPRVKLSFGLTTDTKSPDLKNNGGFAQDIEAHILGDRSTSISRTLYGAAKAYDQAQGKGAYSNIQQKSINKKQDELRDSTEPQAYDGAGMNVAKGLNIAYEGLLKTPRFLYGLTAAPQNFLADQLDIPALATTYDDFLSKTNTTLGFSPLTQIDQLADYYAGNAGEFDKRTRKYDDNIVMSIGKGNWSAAGSQIIDQIAESAPSIAVMAMTSGAGNAAKLGEVSKTLASALPFMSQKNAELQRDTTVPEWKKPLVSVFNGLSEVMIDQKYGTQAAIQGVVDKFMADGAEVALDAGAKMVKGYLQKALSGAKVIQPFIEGAAEEAATQFAQNMLDKYALGKDIDLMDGVADAAIVGGVMTGGITTAGNIIMPKNKKSVTDLHAQQEALLNELDNPDLAPESKEAIAEMLEQNHAEIETVTSQDLKDYNSLSDTQKSQLETMVSGRSVAETIVNDPTASQAVKDAAQKKIDAIDKGIDAIKPEEKETKKAVPVPAAVAEVEAVSVEPPMNDAPISESLQGGVFYMNGDRGVVALDGQTVVFETNDKIVELGNIEELSESRLSEFGIEMEQQLDLNISDDMATVSIDGETYTNPNENFTDALNYDTKGGVISVTLLNEKGQRRTLRGEKGQQIAHEYILKQFENEANDTDIASAIKQADTIIRTEIETEPVDTETADQGIEFEPEAAGETVRPEVPKVKPRIPVEAKPGKLSTRIKDIVKNAPSSAQESISHFFLKGGKVSTDDFIAGTGFGFLKVDRNGRKVKLNPAETAQYLANGKLVTGERVIMSEELRMAKLRGLVADKSKGGLAADDIAKNRIDRFGQDELSMVQELVNSAAMSREDLVSQAEKNAEAAELFGYSPAELAAMEAEQYNEFIEFMNALSDEEIEGLSEGIRNEVLQKANERLNRKPPEQLFTPVEIRMANELIDKHTDKDGNLDFDALEADYYQNIHGRGGFEFVGAEPVFKQILENGYENFNERTKNKKPASSANSESNSQNDSGAVEEAKPKPAEVKPVSEGKKSSGGFDTWTDSDLENEWNDLETDRSPEGKKRFKQVEDELIRRERSSIFDVDVDDIPSVLRAMDKKRKSGTDTFMEVSEGRRVLGVSERYSSTERSKRTNSELIKDFIKGLRGSPESDYADGLLFREAAKEFISRGGTTSELIQEAKGVYKDFSDAEAAQTVAGMLKRIFGDTKASPVETNSSRILDNNKAPVSEAMAEPSKKEGLLRSVQEKLKLSEEEVARKKALASKFRTFNDASRMATLVFDPEFREYAGLVFKDALGDFAGFSAEIVDNVGEGIRGYLPQLYQELGGKDNVGASPVTEAVEPVKASTSFTVLAHKNVSSEEISDTLNNIERETGRELTDEEKQYKVTKRMDAARHGADVVQKAREEFGDDDYAMKLLDYIKTNPTVSVENRSLIIISLENELERRITEEPHNAEPLNKQLKLVRDFSTVQQRSAAIANGYGILRQLIRVGFQLNEAADKMFSAKQKESRSKVTKAVQSDADAINAAADAVEVSTDEVIEARIEEAVRKGVEAEIDAVYKKMPSKMRARADKAIAAIEQFQKKLRSMAYDASIGLPVAILDSGLTTIKYAIKAGVKIADAIELGIDKINSQYGKKWDKEDQFRQDMLQGFKDNNIDVDQGKNSSRGRKVLTEAERLEKAKENVRGRIAEIQSEIANKKRELKARNILNPDAELEGLLAQEEQLKKLRDKILPPAPDPNATQKKIDAQVTRLTNEVADLEEQIRRGEKDAYAANQNPLTSPEIERLKAEKKARLAMLEALDPDPGTMVREALIDAGNGREATVTVVRKDANGNDVRVKEKRTVLDWKKLAGAEGSVDKIQAKVEAYMASRGYSAGEIVRMQAKFVAEYNALRASIIEKSLNELERRNTEKEPVEVKSSARRLAELYNMGLFDQQSDTYDYLMGNALGLSGIGMEAFFQAKVLAKALSDLYLSKGPDGMAYNESNLKKAVIDINKKIERLLDKVAKDEATTTYKIMVMVKEYMGMAQRSMLVSIPQAVENTMSGYIARLYQRVGYAFDKSDTAELRKHRKELAQAVAADINFNAGLEYGEINSPFLSKSRLMESINTASDSKLYHFTASAVLGRVFLEAADSMHKVALTEKFFVYNLIKVLRKKGMSREAALHYVSENLTGQSFEDAKASAKQIIEKVNTDAKTEVIPNNKESIFRLANDIVKEALVRGGKLNLAEVDASFGAAYTGAGFELGHEANNPLSMAVSTVSSNIQNKLNLAIKNKDWARATGYTALSITWTNILNPFVGGGTNWAFIAMEKAGVPTLMTFYYNFIARSPGQKIDLSTDAGMKNLETALRYQMIAKNANNRVFLGAALSVATFVALSASGGDDDLDKWTKKNEWTKRYLKKIAPPVVQYMLANKNNKTGEFIAGLGNIKAPAFDENKKVWDALMGIDSPSDVKSAKTTGAFGDLLGSRLSTPVIPYRIARDAENIYRGLQGVELRNSEFKTSGFFNGFFKGGLVDYLGLRDKYFKSAPKKLTSEDIRKIIEKAKAKAKKDRE
ncbi:hypothetical protein [Sphingobacterium mizutaii]|uniref:hypothetical protein n=1 Tax=Sphingobacterium mizutaii TaxID=1010 RepID=UPI00289B7561|nr:hypothetical protein [Sphingobacterium mizutaii]